MKKVIILALFITLWGTGCASHLSQYHIAEDNQADESRERRVSSVRDYSGFSPLKHHKSLSDYARHLIVDLNKTDSLKGTIAVASFVDFDDTLMQTNQLGNQVAETMMVEMAHLGYPVVDINLADEIMSTRQGNFAFSRSGSSNDASYCCVVSGNLIYEPKGVRVNTKLLNYEDNALISASSVVIPYFVFEHLR